MSEQVKNVYVGAKELPAALSAAGNKGLVARMFVAKEGSKEAFGGYIEIAPATEGKGATVVGLHAYKTTSKGEPLKDKNGQGYMSLVVGNHGDSLRGAVFTNAKREGKKDADFRVIVNLTETETVDGKLWISEPKSGNGAKYLSGRIGSKADTPEDSAPPADSTPAAAPASNDPFGL